jgi:peptidoglycan/LPS O-acetylase OafA/YrhL
MGKKGGDYRPDIDGLRAVAVGGILVFHVAPTALPGGFVGVDVFFVISGYLITNRIVAEIRQGSFSFSEFYLRRVRRLFPAMLATFALSAVGASILLAPQHLAAFAGSLLASLVASANIFFWFDSGYFSLDALTKPLLHVWSLSVEEQFYFVWPLLLLVAAKWRVQFVALALAAIASLALNLVFRNHPATIFYLAPFRVFEFAIGAALVWLPRTLRGAIAEFGFVLGVALIGFAMFRYSSETVFPSVAALVPCMGSALVIAAGGPRFAGVALNNRTAVGIGLISYSLYLVHWPLIVFYSYSRPGQLSAVEGVGLIAASIVIAAGMYLVIETPFRRSSAPARTYVTVCVGLGLMLAVPAITMRDGWLWRFPEARAADYQLKIADLNSYVFARFRPLDREFSGTEKPKLLLIGDSQAADFLNIMLEGDIAPSFEIRTLSIDIGCQPVIADRSIEQFIKPFERDKCRVSHEQLLNDRRIQQADVIVLAAAWLGWSVPLIDRTAAILGGNGTRRVYVVGKKEQTESGLNLLRRGHGSAIEGGARRLNGDIKSNAAHYRYVDLPAAFCDPSRCEWMTPDGRIIFWDTSHITPSGARYLGKKIKDLGVRFGQP